MNYGQGVIHKARTDPFAVAVAVEVPPYSLVVEGGQDFAEGSDLRWELRGSNTRAECNRPVI